MSRRIGLRDYQETLVRRLAAARASNRRTLLGVQSGSENWLIELDDAGAVLPVPPLTPVPRTQSWFRGIANIRGTLYSVVDLASFHSKSLTSSIGQARLVLLGPRHHVNCALLVSQTAGLINQEEFDPDENVDHDDTRPWIARRVRDTQYRLWYVLDIPNLLGQPDFLEASLDKL